MIKNLLVDLGNVMLAYDPRAMAAAWVQNDADQDAIIAALFAHSDWAEYDRGAITEDQLCKNARARLPQRLHGALGRVIGTWSDHLTPLPGAADFLRRMKAAGRRVYALSNAPARYDQFKKDISLLELFDGEIISARLGFSKPGPEIFRYALKAYALNPEECFFIDDLAVNVEGAARCGIDGCVFDGDYHALEALIDKKSAGG
jgi:putative hydrolase of the HAD superfamily